MRKITRKEILTGSPLKTMFLLSLPVMISQFLHTLYHLADTFWLGHLPPAESGGAVAGLQISWPVIWFLIALSFGFGIAGIAFNFSIHRSRRKRKCKFSRQSITFPLYYIWIDCGYLRSYLHSPNSTINNKVSDCC